MAYAARFLIVASFALALSVGAAMAAEEYSPLAPPEPPVIEFIPEVAEIPPAPLGLSKGGEQYSLQSNKSWKGAKQVKPFAKGDPNQYDAYPRQDWSYIWGTTCRPTAQKVVFTQDFYLPGPAKNFGAEIQGTKYGIKQIEIFINGSLAISTQTYPFYILLDENRYAKMLNNGNNIITVEVTKLADTATSKFCQNGPLGVLFRMWGEFEADLQTANFGNQKAVKQLAAGATGFLIKNAPRLSQRGRSAVYRADFGTRVSHSGGTISEAKLTKLGSSIQGCDEILSGVTVTGMDCPIKKWSPGESKSFPSGVTVQSEEPTPAGKQFNQTVNVYWSVSSPTADPNSANNFRSLTIYVCYPDHATLECKGSLPSLP